MENTRDEIVFDAQRIREAKEEARQRILADKERVSEAAWPILEHLAEHLFDANFDAAALRKAPMPDGVRPRQAALRELGAKLGLTPARYIKEQRLRTAAFLLETTGIDVQDVADVVCSVQAQDFSSTFKAWEPKRRAPLEYRAAEGTARYGAKDWLRAWIADWLTVGTAEQCAMLAAAERAQRGSRTAAQDVLDAEVQAVVDFLDAEGLEQTVAAARATAGPTMDLFEGLSRRSREEGRKNRQRGVELAEVALAVVAGSSEELGTRAADGLALGWARLGNARRLASDLEGAAAAIRRARAWAAEATEPARAEVARLEGSLRLFQRRFAEALAAYDEAVALSQAAGAELVLVDTLLQRASVHLYLGEPYEALPDLDKARLLLPPGDERRRSIVVQHSLQAAILAGDTGLAREILPEARRLGHAAADPALSLQVGWLEGWLRREEGDLAAAEPLLKEARAGFIKLQDLGTAAVVALDLALLFHQRGGHARQVMTFASDALPSLRALNLPEAVHAATLLHDAIRERHFHRSVLELARYRLIAPWAP